MYQSVIRDPGNGGIIRVVPDVCSSRAAVVNGSILLVPPGTIAFVVVNGMVSQPYGPGRYELFSGVDPFFVRLRNIMTRGDPGISVSVFYISTQKEQFLQLGTGEVPFIERRFRLTMKVMASCNLTFTVSDAGRLLERMVGAYSTTFSQDDLDPCLEQLILTPIREVLSRELGGLDIILFNSSLSAISGKACGAVAAAFDSYGLSLVRFALTGIHVPEAEMQRLNQLEQSYAEGRTLIDLEKTQLEQIWGGNVGQRTLAEIMTGINNRGGRSSADRQHDSGMNNMTSAVTQAMLLSQLLPALQEPLASMVQHTDLFGGTQMQTDRDGSSADAPPPLPGRTRRCPACNGSAARDAVSCPICGHRFY